MTNQQQAEQVARRAREAEENAWRDKEIQPTDPIKIIKGNIHRSMVDKFPDYARAVAIYNDLIRQLAPGEEYAIEYTGEECRIL